MSYGLGAWGSGNFGTSGEFGAVISTSTTRVGGFLELLPGLRSDDTSTMVVGPVVEATGTDLGIRGTELSSMKSACRASFISGLRSDSGSTSVSSGLILWQGVTDPTGTWTDITDTI